MFLSSLCAKYKLTESGDGYEFPELPCEGQTGYTVPTSPATPPYCDYDLPLAVGSDRGSVAEVSL